MKTTILPALDLYQPLAQVPDDLKEAYARYLPSITPQNAELPGGALGCWLPITAL